MSNRVRKYVAAVCFSGVMVLMAQTAQATYPGSNGRIAYEVGDGVGGDGEIATINPNGTSPLTLTDNSSTDFEPRFTASADSIVFGRFNGIDNDVWTMAADGDGQTQKIAAPGDDEDADYSPNGSKIVFEGSRPKTEIYIQSADGSNLKKLTSKGDNANPAFSPDGKHIVFESDRGGDDEVWVMKANGKDARALTKNKIDEEEPEWSPDGDQIVFGSDRSGGDSEIVVMDANGKNEKLVTRNGSEESEPDFSPDGKLIVYEGDGLGGQDDLYTVKVNGNGTTNLTEDSLDQDSPDWGAAP